MGKKGLTLAVLVVWVFIGPIILIGVSFWTQSNLHFWLSHFKGQEVHVSYWLSLLLTIVGNGIIFAANIISEIAKCLV